MIEDTTTGIILWLMCTFAVLFPLYLSARDSARTRRVGYEYPTPTDKPAGSASVPPPHGGPPRNPLPPCN